MNIKKRAGICPVCKKRNHPLAPDIPGDVCDECQENLLEKASLVICNHCGSLAAVVEHGKTEAGFEFQKGETYTVDFCRRCRPNLVSLEINELNAYLKENNIESDELLKPVKEVV